MSVGEVAAVLSYVLRILGRHTAKGAIQRIVHCGTRGHIDRRENRTCVTVVGALRAAGAILPDQVLADGDISIDVVSTVVAEREVTTVGIEQDTLIVLVGKGESISGLLRSYVECDIVAVVKGGAEDLLHPVGPGGLDPGVLVRIPRVGYRLTGIGVAELSHPELLLGIERARQVGCLTDAVGAVVSQGRLALLRFLCRDEDDTTGSGLRSVDGCGGGILQYHDGFDVTDRGDGCTGDAVHHPEDVVPIL